MILVCVCGQWKPRGQSGGTVNHVGVPRQTRPTNFSSPSPLKVTTAVALLLLLCVRCCCFSAGNDVAEMVSVGCVLHLVQLCVSGGEQGAGRALRVLLLLLRLAVQAT